jgi:hypothetical protein
MNTVKCILLILLITPAAFADRAQNRMVDEFITAAGGNYPTMSISGSAASAESDLLRAAIRNCTAKGKTVDHIYDVKIDIKADYEIISLELDRINGNSQATTYPIWSATARVVCK